MLTELQSSPHHSSLMVVVLYRSCVALFAHTWPPCGTCTTLLPTLPPSFVPSLPAVKPLIGGVGLRVGCVVACCLSSLLCLLVLALLWWWNCMPVPASQLLGRCCFGPLLLPHAVCHFCMLMLCACGTFSLLVLFCSRRFARRIARCWLSIAAAALSIRPLFLDGAGIIVAAAALGPCWRSTSSRSNRSDSLRHVMVGCMRLGGGL